MQRAVGTLVLLMLLVPSLAIAGTVDTGSFYVRGWSGYGMQALKDVNDDIGAQTQWIRDELTLGGGATSRTTFNRDELGAGALSYGGEVGYRFSDVSLGLGVALQRSEADQVVTLDDEDPGSGEYIRGTIRETREVSVLDVTGSITFWVPAAPGLQLGALMGMSRGKLETSTSFDAAISYAGFSPFDLDMTGSGEWDKTSVMAGAFVGYDVALTSTLGLSARSGYRYRSFSDPEGSCKATSILDDGVIRDRASTAYSGALKQGIPFSDAFFDEALDGARSMDLDFSGFFADIGLVMTFGGR